MAIRFDGSGENLKRSATVPSTNYPLTICCWVYIAADRASESEIIQLWNAGETSGQFCGISASRQLFSAVNITYNYGSTLSTGTWYHVALVTDATNSTVFLDGVQDCQSPTASITPGYLMLGGVSYWVNARVASCKVWTAALSGSEITTEKGNYAVTRTSDLWANWKINGATVNDCLVDSSGNSRDLTANGTLSIEDGPSIPDGGGGGARKWLFGART